MSKNESTTLCTWVKRPDGESIECEVLETNIYSPRSIPPLMKIRGIRVPINAINEAYVPQRGIFVMVTS